MTPSAGARLGPDEVTGSLGAGGMGEVYRARDTRLERSVAIKGLQRAGPETACRRVSPRWSWLRYTRRVRSVADDLRDRTIARVLALPVAERIALAFRLGDDDLALYVRASGLEPDEARRRLCARRHAGRTPSASAALDRP